MEITNREIVEELEHQHKLLRTFRLRLQQRQLQEAQQGYNTPPEIVTEIHDLNERISYHEAEIKRLQVLLVIDNKQPKYYLKITSPTPRQKFSGIDGNLVVNVSGTYEIQPPDEAILRLFVKTENGYWRHERITEINKGRWSGKIGLWKRDYESPYKGYIIAAVLDEAGEDMVLYANKVQQLTNRNISFDKLPHYLEKSNEIIVYRE